MMKMLLIMGHPLTININFSNLNNNYSENPNPNIKILENEENEEFIGDYVYTYTIDNNNPHSMTIVGYNDDICYDLNNDEDIQDFEKGAFLLANSHGSESFNDGFVWLMYDALNNTSNISTLNDPTLNRCAAIINNTYYYIEVEERSNDLMVEVTIEQTQRNDFTISIGSSASENNASIKTTIVDKIGGPYSFSGYDGYPIDTRIFVFDYDTLYCTNNNYYYISIVDHGPDNGADTIIKSVRWLNSYGDVLYEIGEQPPLSGEKLNLAYSKVPGNNILLLSNNFKLYSNENFNIKQNLALFGFDWNELSYSSSTPECVSIDYNGNLEYNGVGSALVTITANGENLITKTCTITTYDDYCDTQSRAQSISLNNTIEGNLDNAYDVDCFKIVPQKDEDIILYSQGYADTIIKAYDDTGNLIRMNDDYETATYNSAILFRVYTHLTYYIEISSYAGQDGNYSLIIQETNRGILTCDLVNTSSYKHILIEGQFASFFDNLFIQIDNHVEPFEIPDNLETIVYETNTEKYIIKLNRNGLFLFYDIDIYIYEGSSLSCEQIRFSFLKKTLNNNFLLADFYLL